MVKPQIEIGQRAFEEVLRLFDRTEDAKAALGVTGNRILYDWMSGSSPSAKYLQRLHFVGADVIYILTGRRSQNVLPEVQKREHQGGRHDAWCKQ